MLNNLKRDPRKHDFVFNKVLSGKEIILSLLILKIFLIAKIKSEPKLPLVEKQLSLMLAQEVPCVAIWFEGSCFALCSDMFAEQLYFYLVPSVIREMA